jgi:hypothetical protein
MTARRLLLPVFLMDAGVLVSGLRVEGGEASDGPAGRP